MDVRFFAGQGYCKSYCIPMWLPGSRGGSTPHPRNSRTHEKHLPNGPLRELAGLLTRPPGGTPIAFRGSARSGNRPVNAVDKPEIHTPTRCVTITPLGLAATGERARSEQPLTFPRQEDPHARLQPPRVARNCADSAVLVPAVASHQEGPAAFGCRLPVGSASIQVRKVRKCGKPGNPLSGLGFLSALSFRSA